MAAKSASTFSRSRLIVFAVFPIVLGGCNWLELNKHLRAEWSALLIVLTGHPSRLAEKAALREQTPDEPQFSANAARSNANAEVLHEIHRVVYGSEPSNRAEFGSLVDSLNQGASFEGIYNGFVHSGDYRKLEIVHDRTSRVAVRVFSEGLVAIELQLSKPTLFESSVARPLRHIDPQNPQEGDGDANVLEFPKKMPTTQDSKAKSNAMIEEYERIFSHSSIYTLKRILGDEALKLVSEKKLKREVLASWYSKWAVGMAAMNVDFGLPQRNIVDEKFHYEWAMKAPVDNLEWEILNRIHRVLNRAHEMKS